jgi:beta-lactamase class A
MRRLSVLLVILLSGVLWSAAPPAQPPVRRAVATFDAPPPEVQLGLDRLVAGFRGDVGVAVMDVQDGWMAGYNLNRHFPQQSVSKLWVAVTVLDRVDQGRLKTSDVVMVRPEDLSVFYQPIARDVGRAGYVTTVGDLLRRALGESDNAADDMLLRLVGGPPAVTETLRRKGLEGIRGGPDQKTLQSAIAGVEWRPEYAGRNDLFRAARSQVAPEVRNAALSAYLADPADGATPAGAVQALGDIGRGEVLSKQSTAFLLTAMGGAVTGRMRLRGGLDSDWFIAHKTGTGPDWAGGSTGINDLALLTAPDGRLYAVAVFIAHTDAPVPERLAFMQQVARTVVEHWNAAHSTQGPQARPATPSATVQTDS